MKGLYWLAAIGLLGVTLWGIQKILQVRETRRLKALQDEAVTEEETQRVHKTRKAFLEKVREWDTVMSLPFIEGKMDGVSRGFLFIPTLNGHMPWLAGLVNSGRFIPTRTKVFNNRDPEQSGNVQRQVKELRSKDCSVAPPGTAFHLYELALSGSSGTGHTMDEVPHDTIADVGFQAIPMEQVPARGEGAASESIIVDQSAFEMPSGVDPHAETTEDPQSNRSTLAWHGGPPSNNGRTGGGIDT